jgi:hypothetical protein
MAFIEPTAPKRWPAGQLQARCVFTKGSIVFTASTLAGLGFPEGTPYRILVDPDRRAIAIRRGVAGHPLIKRQRRQVTLAGGAAFRALDIHWTSDPIKVDIRREEGDLVLTLPEITA